MDSSRTEFTSPEYCVNPILIWAGLHVSEESMDFTIAFRKEINPATHIEIYYVYFMYVSTDAMRSTTFPWWCFLVWCFLFDIPVFMAKFLILFVRTKKKGHILELGNTAHIKGVVNVCRKNWFYF